VLIVVRIVVLIVLAPRVKGRGILQVVVVVAALAPRAIKVKEILPLVDVVVPRRILVKNSFLSNHLKQLTYYVL
jgi:hypothetical protein